MARQGMVEAEGQVDKILGGGFYAVTLTNNAAVKVKLSGRLRQHRIRVLPGDRVRVELSEMDLTKGFIVYRYN